MAARHRWIAFLHSGQWPVAHYLGPYLPDLSGALVSFWLLFLFVKVWRPKTIRGFGGRPLALAPVLAAMAWNWTSFPPVKRFPRGCLTGADSRSSWPGPVRGRICPLSAGSN